MLNVILKPNDSIETVLPTVELAMQSGTVCRIRNIRYLGCRHWAALSLLAQSESLLDAGSGIVIHPRPGFRLLGLDGVRPRMK